MIVFLDTNIVIYAVEDPPILGAQALARFTALRSNGDTFMVSDLTRMESLVGPLKTGDTVVESQFRTFFGATGMQVVAITAAVCERQRCSQAENYGGSQSRIGTALAVRLNARRARPKTDQRRGYQWQTRINLRRPGEPQRRTNFKSRH